MRPLSLDDLLPLGEFAGQRREFFEAHRRYLDRYRRIRIGPQLTLIFENRQTLWFRVQDVLRIARLEEPAAVQQELAVYNRLLPGRDRLQAALLIHVTEEARLNEELEPWRNLRGEDLRLRIGEASYPAELQTCRPEDRCIGAAHWLQLPLDGPGRRLLADFGKPAYFEIGTTHYRHVSPPLGEDVRQSLLDDLEMSARDAA